MTPLPLLLPLLATTLMVALPAQKHEELGRMWTFEHAPLDWFDEAYGFKPTPQWMEHVRLASLRFGGGCSASFVSPRGLILTNHHCARDYVANLSPADEDWLKDGYFARSLQQEVEVPGLTVQQLVAMADVTDRVLDGLVEGEDAAARQKRVAENIAAITAAAKEQQPELTQQLVSLYQGGRYSLYSYRIYDDIRLVAVPQLQSAKFGGDPDNFTYPRYCLDFAVLRAYDDGKPADTTSHYFRVKAQGAAEGDLVFVTGNPGSTGRLNTIAQMEFLRDVQYPQTLSNIDSQLADLREQAAADAAFAKQNRSQILSMENRQKAVRGYLDGLLNDQVMNLKQAAEDAIRRRIDGDPQLKERFGTVFSDLEKLMGKIRRGQAGRADLARVPEATRRVGEAYFAVYGTEIPPDATFTLRLSDGVVTGFPCNGTIAPWFTSLYGLYGRNTEFGNRDPFHLPQVWLDRRDALDLTTPFNLVATPDIIGGNSGSPLINKKAEVVGLVFDGNIEMLGNRFVFTDEVARTVCVHPAIIIAALRTVYDAPKVADELEGKGRGNR